MDKLFLEGSAEAKRLTASGRLTIQDASRLKDLLMEAYNSSESLSIDLTEAESMDLTCIQVLCSANMTFRKGRKPIGITGKLPDGIIKSQRDIAVELANCSLELPYQCLWGEGDE